MSFVHLHVHTEYSLVDGLIPIPSLIKQTVKDKAPAVALTDQHNLFAAVKLFSKAPSAGIKPIIGADIRIRHPKDKASSRLVLLCMNNEGYLNLSKLLSLAYTDGQVDGVPMIQADWLTKESAGGLICITGGPDGVFSQLLSNPAALKRAIEQFTDLFPDRLYLELLRLGREGDEFLLSRTLDLAETYKLPVVATNDVRFLKQEDFEAHEARVCIGEGVTLDNPSRSRSYTPEQYLKSPSQMQALFADLPEAIENTVEIARRCNTVIELGNHYLPDFPVPEGMTVGEFLAAESFKGLEERFEVLFPDDEDKKRHKETYWARLQVEIDVINNMGFPGYFLIVADFIGWAKRNGVPVGPGRGSGAGSLVAYALKITDLDPLAYDLLFERFLNPERVSLPDFDVDFCMVGRDRVIEYVSRTYGRDHVSQIITFGTMAAKAVLRDVGRVMGLPYPMVDGLSKLIPFELKMTLDKALDAEPRLKHRYDTDDEVKNLIDLARQLEGRVRNVGKHAGGVVIAPKPLPHYTPVYCESNGASLVSQFDKDDVEEAGLVKFDFLGLKTLTVIDYAVTNIEKSTGKKIDINTIPLDDPATYALLKKGQTTAVFQLESRGMRELVKKLAPDTFEDIIALVALFRPGPLQSGMVDDFVNRKHGRSEIAYPHPDLEAVLKPTYGVIVYQEQVMQIAQILAGYTLGGADMLRRAMGKKKADEMAMQRDLFVGGAQKQGIDPKQAGSIFDLMEKFAEYGFNKSHSAAYALIAYQTAWLKAHYPAAFMAAVMTADMDNTDKIIGFIKEGRDMGLAVLPPDVNESEVGFSVVSGSDIRYGMGAIRGVGEAALGGVIRDREKAGAFVDLFDFARRIDSKAINAKTLSSLIHAGAFDSIDTNRASLHASIPTAIKLSRQHQQQNTSGQIALFGEVDEEEYGASLMTQAKPYSRREKLMREKEVLGLFLTGHPIDSYAAEIDRLVPARIADLEAPESKGYQRVEKDVLTAGLIVEIRIIPTKRGGRMAIITIDDNTARIDVRLFEEQLVRHEFILRRDSLIFIKGKISMDNFTGAPSVTANQLFSIEEMRSQKLRRILITPEGRLSESDVGSLKQLLGAVTRGNVPIALFHQGDTASGILEFGEEWSVLPTDLLMEKIRDLAFIQKVNYVY